MPQHKIKRKEKYSSNKAELSLLVYLPYLFMLQPHRRDCTGKGPSTYTVCTYSMVPSSRLDVGNLSVQTVVLKLIALTLLMVIKQVIQQTKFSVMMEVWWSSYSKEVWWSSEGGVVV